MTTPEYTTTYSKRYGCNQCNRIIEGDSDRCLACGQPINVETGEGLGPVIWSVRTNGINRSEAAAYLNEKRFCLKCGGRLAYDEAAFKEEPCPDCGQTYELFNAKTYVGENPPRMYCQGCWEALDIRHGKCSRCGLAFDRQNSWTYYTGRPAWKSAFSMPGHLIWPAIIVLGIRAFGGPLPWPWWATFIGLTVFSGASGFRVTHPERERKIRRLNALHRVFVLVLISTITFITAYAW